MDKNQQLQQLYQGAKEHLQAPSAQLSNPLQYGPPTTEGISNVTGTLGSLGLGTLAGFLTAGNPLAIRAGMVGGGAIGGPIPQISNDMALKQNPFKDPIVYKQAGEQGLYGLLPGGEAVKPEAEATMKTIGGGVKKAVASIPKRFITGTGVGAVEDLFQNNGQVDPAQMTGQALVTGGLHTLIPGFGDILAGAGKDLENKTTQAIKQRIQDVPTKVEQLGWRNAADNLVGHYNTDYATNEGILPVSHIDEKKQSHPKVTFDTQAINDALDKRSAKAQQVRQDLMNALPDNIKIPPEDIQTMIKNNLVNTYNLNPRDTKAVNQAYDNFLSTIRTNAESNLKFIGATTGASNEIKVPKFTPAIYDKAGLIPIGGETGSDITGFIDKRTGDLVDPKEAKVRISKYQGPIANTKGASKGGYTPQSLQDFIQGKYPGSLKLVNALKETIGDKWDSKNSSSVYNKTYMDLKNYIEQKSGNPDTIKSLNQESYQLSDIRSNLQDAKDSRVPPAGTTAEDIALQKELARNKKPINATLNMVSNIAGLGVGMGGYALLNALTNLGIVGSGSGAWLIGMGARNATEKLLNDPGVQEKVAQFIEAKGTKRVMTEVGKALQQLGIKQSVSQSLSQ